MKGDWVTFKLSGSPERYYVEWVKELDEIWTGKYNHAWINFSRVVYEVITHGRGMQLLNYKASYFSPTPILRIRAVHITNMSVIDKGSEIVGSLDESLNSMVPIPIKIKEA